MDNIRLVKQCKSGDREAFGLLYETYLPAMREVVAYYIHNSDAVWDIIHDGFLIAFTSIGTLRNESKVESWLTTIMKNLSLQYLKNESYHISVPMSDISVDGNIDITSQEEQKITFDELNALIDKLPNGYGKVFRLAVLDSLSHKEIGTLLGIAPHSSSSQLTHAKAMLRRMIIKYRSEMGILSVLGILLLLWHSLFRLEKEKSKIQTMSKNIKETTSFISDTITNKISTQDRTIPEHKVGSKKVKLIEQEYITDEIFNDSITESTQDSVISDSIRKLPTPIDIEELIVQTNETYTQHSKTHDWSLSLAYTGNLEQNDINNYKIPNPGAPDAEGPGDEIEVTEKTHHHMPLMICLSVNKPLTSRWSVETGLRYTFMQSDFLSESEVIKKETIQRIHYVGIPIQFNYHILTHKNFSIYGHGGGALDIPIIGHQSISEYSPESGNLNKNTIHIHGPLQWSIESGIGLQYNISPSFSIYAEPSFIYYFNSGSDIKTIRKEKPIEWSIPIGIRLSW